ncbi:TIGR00282 family metallophosphoesterase [Magnetococcales bacterium HHB-1]
MGQDEENEHEIETQEIIVVAIGDIVGRSGREALKQYLPLIHEHLAPDAVIVNGENAAGGIGITATLVETFLKEGVTVVTSGNHIWRHKEIKPYLIEEPRLLRPANYPPGAPGEGVIRLDLANGYRLGVMNLLGRVFMDAIDCPFRAVDAILERWPLGDMVDAWIIDFHAEATSEKVALAHYLDGRVSAVVGTHTHVPTADARVLPGGCGFQTDLGMTGCYQSVIGMQVESVLPRFLTGLPTRFVPENSEASLCGAYIRIHAQTGKCQQILPIRLGPDLLTTSFIEQE